MVLRQTGAILLIIIVLRMPIKDSRPPVNAKPYRPWHGTATQPNILPAKYLSGPDVPLTG